MTAEPSPWPPNHDSELPTALRREGDSRTFLKENTKINTSQHSFIHQFVKPWSDIRSGQACSGSHKSGEMRPFRGATSTGVRHMS